MVTLNEKVMKAEIRYIDSSGTLGMQRRFEGVMLHLGERSSFSMRHKAEMWFCAETAKEMGLLPDKIPERFKDSDEIKRKYMEAWMRALEGESFSISSGLSKDVERKLAEMIRERAKKANQEMERQRMEEQKGRQQPQRR